MDFALQMLNSALKMLDFAQLDEDTDGSLTTAELNEALQLYDTTQTGGSGLSSTDDVSQELFF